MEDGTSAWMVLAVVRVLVTRGSRRGSWVSCPVLALTFGMSPCVAHTYMPFGSIVMKNVVVVMFI